MTTQCILLYGNFSHPLTKYSGTFRIATELRQHGYETQCVDLMAFNRFDDNLKEILTKLITKETLWIGFSTTFLGTIMGLPFARSQKIFDTRFNDSFKNGIKEFVKFIKELNPNIEIIAGGSRRFLLEEFGIKVFEFYADKEIIEFTEWCEGKNKNLTYKLAKVIKGSEFADFNKSQIIYEKSDIIEPHDVLGVEVSRGCIFRCKFCAFPLNGKTKGDWIKDAGTLYDELTRNYELHGVTHYAFSDDTYNDSLDKVKFLYDNVFSKLNFKFEFTTYLRLDLMIRFPESVKYLAESGLKSALFGIETINPESAKAIGKGLDPAVQFQFIEEIKKNEFKNILTYSGFILGLPHDTEEDIWKLDEFLFSDKNKLDLFSIFPLLISPPEFENIAKNTKSEFDLNYEKYNYEVYEQLDPYVPSAPGHVVPRAYGDTRWINHKTGLTYDRVEEAAADIRSKIWHSDKFKTGEFFYGHFRSLGIPGEDLVTLSRRQIYAKYNILNLIEEKKLRYLEKLRNHIK